MGGGGCTQRHKEHELPEGEEEISDEKENVGRRRRKCVSRSKEAAENSIWNVQARLMKFAAAPSLFTSFYALSSLPPENTYFEEGRSPVSTSVPNFALLYTARVLC
jgi:hypothetical protein